MKRNLYFAGLLAACSFTLHLLWERMHISLYTGYEALEGVLPVYVYASVGDVMYTFIGLGIASAVLRQALWRVVPPHAYVLLAGIGLILAVFVEFKAMLLGRWAYTDAMPHILGFGLSPMVQMTILLPLSVGLSVFVLRRFGVY